MADWNLQSTWEQAYSIRAGFPGKSGWLNAEPDKEFLSYLDGRSFAEQVANDIDGGLAFHRGFLNGINASGAFTPAAETLVVGCGFGWLIELILQAGSNSIWGTDISTQIHSRLSTPAAYGVDPAVAALIANVNISDANAADQFKALGFGNNKGQFRNIVTEHVMSTLQLAELLPFLDSIDALRSPGQSQVFHLVASNDASGANWDDPDWRDQEILPSRLFFAEWVALRPEHIWIDTPTRQIGGGQ